MKNEEARGILSRVARGPQICVISWRTGFYVINFTGVSRYLFIRIFFRKMQECCLCDIYVALRTTDTEKIK